jgi:hypothetical protein
MGSAFWSFALDKVSVPIAQIVHLGPVDIAMNTKLVDDLSLEEAFDRFPMGGRHRQLFQSPLFQRLRISAARCRDRRVATTSRRRIESANTPAAANLQQASTPGNAPMAALIRC